MKICAVIVTFNRANMLAKTLNYFNQLTDPPETIVIIDNNSTDNTHTVANDWKNNSTIYQDIHYIKLPENIGGSGGFYKGIEYAMTLSPDWIWLSDDDAFPASDCFTIIRKKIREINPQDYSALCCSVINNGKIDIMHRRKLVKKWITLKEIAIPMDEYQKPEFNIQLFSYVGVVINSKKLQQTGLPEKDYFIWYDDSEHSWRISKYGKIICLSQAKIYHNTPVENNVLNWKAFYGARNRLLMYKKLHYMTYLKHLLLLNKKIIFSNTLKKNPVYKQMLIAAIRDAMQDKKGLHALYKPGWKPTD